MLNKIRNPILFQGGRKRKDYFEGWYYKQVSADERTAVCFIPGVSFASGDDHSFVQLICVRTGETGGKPVKTGYLRYRPDDFQYSDSPFLIRIANNSFSESTVSVRLKDADIDIEGTLELGPFAAIRRSVLAPNIMGFFAYLPGMECYHGIISMNHILHGKLKIDGTEVDFNGGKGYLEKDWGTSFPQKYIWIQCNNFKDKNTSIFCSAADIPFMNRHFLGYICNLTTGGKEYRFATYNRSKLKIERMDDQKIVLVLNNEKMKLRIEANLKTAGELIAPKRGQMNEMIKEGLAGEVRIWLYDGQGELLCEDMSNTAGMEAVGFSEYDLI